MKRAARRFGSELTEAEVELKVTEGKNTPLEMASYIWMGHGSEDFEHGKPVIFQRKNIPDNSVYVTTRPMGAENDFEAGLHTMVMKKLQEGTLDAPSILNLENLEELNNKVSTCTQSDIEIWDLLSEKSSRVHVHSRNSSIESRKTYVDGELIPEQFQQNGLPLCGIVDLSSLRQSTDSIISNLNGVTFLNDDGSLNCRELSGFWPQLTFFTLDTDRGHNTEWVLTEAYKYSVWPTRSDIDIVKNIAKQMRIDNPSIEELDILKTCCRFIGTNYKIKYSNIFEKFPGIHYSYVCRVPKESDPDNPNLTGDLLAANDLQRTGLMRALSNSTQPSDSDLSDIFRQTPSLTENKKIKELMTLGKMLSDIKAPTEIRKSVFSVGSVRSTPKAKTTKAKRKGGSKTRKTRKHRRTRKHR